LKNLQYLRYAQFVKNFTYDQYAAFFTNCASLDLEGFSSRLIESFPELCISSGYGFLKF